MLKSYITRIDNIGKFEVGQYLKYLMNSNHENHIGRTKIFNNSQDYKTFHILNSKKIRANYQRTKRGKNLKISNKSLTFNVPISYNPSDENLINIQNNLMNYLIEVYKKNGVNVSEEDFFSNIHLQQNNHVNFVIPTLDENGKSLTILDKKGKPKRWLYEQTFYFTCCDEFTKIVDNEMGTNYKEYDRENETLAFLESEEEKVINYTLEEIQQLKEKYKSKPLIKRFYSYVYRIRNKQLEQEGYDKDLNHLKNTIKKIISGESHEDGVGAALDRLGIRDEINTIYDELDLRSKKYKDSQANRKLWVDSHEKLQEENKRLKNPKLKIQRK